MKVAFLKELHVHSHYWGPWRGNKECDVLFIMLRRLEGQQIDHQIYLKVLVLNCLAKNYYMY